MVSSSSSSVVLLLLVSSAALIAAQKIRPWSVVSEGLLTTELGIAFVNEKVRKIDRKGKQKRSLTKKLSFPLSFSVAISLRFRLSLVFQRARLLSVPLVAISEEIE
jgi:hypothetical protein